jgi:hypothetical protein
VASCLREGEATGPHESEPGRKIEDAGGVQSRVFAQRMARDGGGLNAIGAEDLEGRGAGNE